MAAATAKRKHTKPDASFNSDSPSRISISRFGIGTRVAMADTATASVGERSAARAQPTASGTAGIIQWMKNPAPTTVNRTKPNAERDDGPLVPEQAWFRNAPTVQEQQRCDEHQQKELRIERDVQIEGERDQCAEPDLDERQGQY